MNTKVDLEVVDLIEQLRQMQEAAKGLAAQPLELRKQLQAAEEKAQGLHHKIVEEKSDVGGEA